MADQYGTAIRDPGAYDTRAMIGLRSEGEALYNNWKVEHEILDNTAKGGEPGTRIGIYGDWPDHTLEQMFQYSHKANVAAGQSDEQDRNILVDRAAALNALQQPSEDPTKSYYDFYGGANKRVVAPGLGTPTAVQLTDPNGDGKITSMTETYASGIQGTQNYGPNGKLTSANVKDGDGNVQTRTEYARQNDGAYSATTYDGQDVMTEKDDFDKDGAEVAHTYGKKGAETVQSYDSSGAPKGEAAASAKSSASDAPDAALPELPPTAQVNDGEQAPDAGIEEQSFAENNTDPDAG